MVWDNDDDDKEDDDDVELPFVVCVVTLDNASFNKFDCCDIGCIKL